MSFFNSLLQKYNLPNHDDRPLWKYVLSDQDFEDLLSSLKRTSSYYIDSRDATLYYAEYWKRNYNGGSPGKEEVFSSIGGNIKYYMTSNEFFEYAKRGARILGVKWIKRQKTLYFRTLLIQGGLPLNHISQNQGKYQSFLLAVLEEQPETIEDFMFKPEIVGYLPKSSQNEVIYQNSLEIVRAIMNDDKAYDDLFENDEVIKTISGVLKVRNKSIKKHQRLSKPKNYWLLNFKGEKPGITLRLGLADSYSKKSLSDILGFEVIEREYQFYLNDELICVFRKLLNENYKTDWYNVQDYAWDSESIFPQAYVMVDGIKTEVNDFIQIMPAFDEPSLWTSHSDFEWRLVKGSGASNKQAAVLFPGNWYTEQLSRTFQLYGKEMSWLEFEGECQVNTQDEYRKYKSNVSSFDWTILSQKPSWMLKSNMAVIQGKLKVLVYDDNNKKLPEIAYDIYIKTRNISQTWENISDVKYLPQGHIIIKIEKDGLTTYDECFNIGNFQLNYLNTSINQAKLRVNNAGGFQFTLDKSEIMDIEAIGSEYSLKVNTSHLRVPTGLRGMLSYGKSKGLSFVLESPFQGMALIDANGNLISESTPLSLRSLYGIRILSTPGRETILRIKNKLKPYVVISKEIKSVSQPMIAFKDEIVRLYYLADAMDYKNKVCIELKEGSHLKSYEISGFSHTLNVENQFLREVGLFDSEDHLDLYAIPLNCETNQIAPIPLLNGGDTYKIPACETANQFIIISSEEGQHQLMPRFVNTKEDFQGIDKEERINKYHQELAQNNFQSEYWKQLLAYFNLAVRYNIPFSTFDQIRSIAKSGAVAARAFLFLGVNQYDPESFIQKSIPEVEKDLGISFHWINRTDWESALEEISLTYGVQYFEKYFGLRSSYFYENDLCEVLQFLNSGKIEASSVSHMQIDSLRSKLGQRVLKELPRICPEIYNDYRIPLKQHKEVSLLIKAAVCVAESIKEIEQDYSIWSANERANSERRNIQYCQYLDKDFYKKTILHVLK
ncbi:hypothetical protein [Aestuariibaculum marinum]|uniref:Uncharacterized protein n=1 Tax=Aestuariibaculum marinum TaxID=2683592 RepID=A0A8J6QBB3_9FLAO|nr:hypothetical protein [Aestuariibaculum marinum]MBD0824421.1 hypothetical protein [Aestuariibaculum marinum]